MDIPVEMDSVHYCYVVYNDQVGKVQKRLRYKDQGFFIEKDLFDEKIRDKDIQVDLFYHMPDEEFLLIESLTIVFIPWE